MFHLRDNVIDLQDIDAEYVSLEDIVPVEDDGDGEKTLDQAFYDKLTVALGERVKQCAPRVPVVTGTCFDMSASILELAFANRLFWICAWIIVAPSREGLHGFVLCACGRRA
jgi:hypothetical protein